MPEEDSANHKQSNRKAASAEATRTAARAAQQRPQPISVESTDATAGVEQQTWEQERQLLIEQLEQAQAALQLHASPSSERSNLERIHQLERALDQSLAQVNELRSQLLEQQTLEAQLAIAEEVANLQHLALAQLKQQLSCQQQALEDQITQAQAKDQTVRELLVTIETLVEEQQLQVESLKAQLANNRQTIQTSQKQLEIQLIQRQTELESKQQQLQELESQILAARARASSLEVQLVEQDRHIQSLYSRLGDRAYFLNQLETQLKQAHEALEAQQDLHASLMQIQALSREQNTTITNLHCKIETLETQLAQHMTRAAQLQQACQELATERDRYQDRTIELEGHHSALQEQILMQAQQASEYEAAIQYWKDQYTASSHQAQQLKELLERVLPDRPDEILALLMAIQPSEPGSSSSPPQPGKHLQVDLPAFLRKTLPNS